MSLVKFLYSRRCFGWRRGSEDTERIVGDDRLSADDGADMSYGAVTAPTISARVRELEDSVKKLAERHDDLENKSERLEEKINRLEDKVDRLEEEVEAQGRRLDKQQSQIESLRQGMVYERQQLWRRHDVTYSPSYRSEEEEEAQPPESSS